ncbi:MAG: glutathione S-transferase [Rhizobiales bacterium 65-9]|nr:glutathione S-transferase N-terminal domain-containing protein [Hyphomicrobiales bacterium]OJY38720.1 MAG: glutathione S-transferase [Rhizobiales bacterium 65-9]
MAITLYYSPGACSLAPHIVLEEAGFPFTAERVDFSKAQQRSQDYLRINPKARVPALVDGDFIVTENPAILRYIAALAPEKQLWPDNARDEARCMEWMAWMSSGLHVSYAHIRRAERYATGEAALESVRAKGREATREIWEAVEKKMPSGSWLAGDRYSVADPYLYVFWAWGGGQVLGYDMDREFPKWSALARRVAERPATQRALAREKAAA